MTEQAQDVEEGGQIARIAAVAAVAVVCAGIAIVLLSAGDPYKVKMRFQTASNVVKGNLVQSAGRPVGTVEKVELLDGGEAQLTVELNDTVSPLREGTEATIRQRSQSGSASKYIELKLAPAGAAEIPDGGVLPSSNTTAAVDIDQLFDLFDAKTRRGLTNFIRGNATLYAGRGEQANAGWEYLNPSIVATTRLFAELHRDDQLLKRFVVANSKLVTDVAERRDDLAALVDGLADTTGAIARERTSLAEAISRLPPFMRRANTTFVNLRSTLDDVDPLVVESMPVARRLRRVLPQLRGFAVDARPVVRDLADLVRRRGPRNDLLELSRSTLPLRDIAIGPVQANGRQRRGAFPEAADSLRDQTPIWAFQRPYSVDLTGWFDDFSHSGIYDANGNASRVATSANAFRILEGPIPTLDFIPFADRDAVFRQVSALDQNNRCPGAIERDRGDGSTPFRPSPSYNCDPSQLPLGP